VHVRVSDDGLAVQAYIRGRRDEVVERGIECGSREKEVCPVSPCPRAEIWEDDVDEHLRQGMRASMG